MSGLAESNKRKRIIVSLLSLSLMTPVAVYAASQITGVNNPGDIGHINGDSVIKGDGNFIYNIAPTAKNGDVGFRQYKNFNLSEADIANLIFKYGEENVSKFVNFVDNTININGIVNSMRDGNFADGHAIFVSPNGMVVGASGVLNVGSLSVLTPSTQDYTKFKGNMYQYSPILANEGTPEYNALMNSNGTGTININGKIVARDLVNLRAADISVGSNANIMAGVKDAATLLNTNAQADALFNQLVKTDAMSANSFQNTNGSIKITSYGANGGFNADSSSVITNFGKGDTLIASAGIKGVKLNGKLTNSNGNTSITSNKGGILNSGLTQNKGGNLDMLSKDGGVVVNGTGFVKNSDGTLTITSKGTGGILVDSSARVQNTNKKVILNNYGSKDTEIKGLVNGYGVDINNENSNVIIGDETSNDKYITSNGDINININNGSLLNYGVKKTHIVTKDGGNLSIKVIDGSIGKDVPDGIGPDARDLTKSINGNIEGTYTAITSRNNKANDLNINLAAIDSDMKVNHINADGKVYLLADSSVKGETPYSILNASKDSSKANVQGKGISLIASGNIGSNDKALTFNQTEGAFNHDGLNMEDLTYKPNAKYKVDMLAKKGDINVKGLDDKYDTNVGAIVAREGNVNAEFSNNTFIHEVTAKNKINLVTRGKNMYIEHLGEVPTYANTNDYYGPYTKAITPKQVKVSALDLGTVTNPNTAADSLIIIKNGKISGQKQGRPETQDLTLVADNAYAGGYYFNMGKNRGKIEGTDKYNLSYYTVDNRTNKITNNCNENISIRAKAVRPEDVTAIGRDESERNYYYGGSSQQDDPKYDKDGNLVPDEIKGTEKDDDNLVVPEATKPTEPTGPDPTEPTGPDPTEPTGPDPTEPTGPDPTEPTGPDPTEPTGPDPTEPTGPDPTEPTGPDPTEPTGPDPTEPTGPDPTEPTGPDPTEPTGPTEPTQPTTPDRDDLDKLTWVQRKDISDAVPTIDKRQFIRFDANNSKTPIELARTSNNAVESVLDISRGGIAVKHNKGLKVGDTFPVEIECGDLNIAANVKVVTATDRRAGAEFVNLDESTANKLLYMNLLLDSSNNISFNR